MKVSKPMKKQIEDTLVEETGAIRWKCTECKESGILLPESKITNYIKSINESASEIIFSACVNHKEEVKDDT